MKIVYLAALTIALGVLVLQIAVGSKDASADHSKEVDAGEAGLVAVFLSTRFWIFALLGFGLSGTLLHTFALAGAAFTAGMAIGSGLAAGMFTVFAYRAIA